jgi:hypothetical protein
MATKTRTLTVSGTLTRCKVQDEREADWDYSHRYSPNSEHRCKYLDCAIEDDDGRTFYFKTPRSPYRITLGGPYAIITFSDSQYDEASDRYVFPSDHPWFREQGTSAVATAGQPSDKTIVPTVREGDRITITGRIKTEATSRRGNAYTVLSHIKRVL